MAAYSFVTTWRFPQPIDKVWNAINTPEDYPRWWPNILYYECLTPDRPVGVGARGRRAVRGFLPYSLEYTTTITKSEAPHDMTYDADGDLAGTGRFLLREADGQAGAIETEVTLFWNVSTNGKWLNRLAPLLKWLFAANHNYVMRRGERGLAKWLER
jgi:uncharacterized protein YndB with AHSA1/START domain